MEDRRQSIRERSISSDAGDPSDVAERLALASGSGPVYVGLDLRESSQVSRREIERVKVLNVRTTVLGCSRSLLEQAAGGQVTFLTDL